MTNINVKKPYFLLQSAIIPLSFLPTSRLFCKDATHIDCTIIKTTQLKSNSMVLLLGGFGHVPCIQYYVLETCYKAAWGD